MSIGVLGTLTVDDQPVRLGHRDRVVLSVLATRPGSVMSRDRLVDALWRRTPPASANKVLQGCVVRLRRLLGAETIETASPGYRLRVTVDELDSLRFERIIARARDLVALGQHDRAAHMVGDALMMWRGQPFPDLEDWEPAVVEAARLDELRLEAEELRVDACLRAGRPYAVLADAAALVREAPARERRWALLARAQYQDGRQTEALRTLQRARGLLADRLGLDPGPDLVALEEAVLRQEPSLLPQSPESPEAARCPWRGLAPYDVDDAETFFGRDPELHACLDLLSRTGVVAVVGPSGSGKSSLVRAGIAASLRRAGTGTVALTPGEAPIEALEAHPRPAGSALVVDQCEEVFALCPDPDVRQAFLDRLTDEARRGPLVIALRADHLSHSSAHPGFARLVERGLHLLGAMDESGLRSAIEAPARAEGLILEPGLVDLLLREVQGEPGALPLLSHALQETWARREGTTMTVAGYQATGGIRGAVSQTAEQVYAGVDPTQRHLLRELLLRLISAGTDGEPSRLRVARSRVIVEPAQERLVDRLVAARLLTIEEGVIEIAHESLTRAWPRLQGWLDDDVEGRRILHHLTTASDGWDSLGRPDSELYRGARLTQALEWRDSAAVELTAVEADFLSASRRVAEAEERSFALVAEEQTRMIRRLRGALVGATVFLVIALVAGSAAVRQTRIAQDSERATQAARTGARALTVEDPSLALLLAVEGVRLDDTVETRGYLRQAMARRPALVSTTERVSPLLTYLSLSPDGQKVAGYQSDNTVSLFDVTTGRVLARHDADGEGQSRKALHPPGAIGHSPDGRVLAVGSQLWADQATHPALRLLDADTLAPLETQPGGLPGRPAKTVSVDFSRDGRRLAASMMFIAGNQAPSAAAQVVGGAVLVWDLDDLSAPVARIPMPPPQGSWYRMQLSGDGETVYTGAPPTAFDVATGKARWTVEGVPVVGGLLDLSRDGRWLATPSYDAVYVIDTRNGSVAERLAEGRHSGAVAFSADGSMLAASLDWSVVRVWDRRTGDVLGDFRTGSEGAVAFSPDGSLLHFGGVESVQTWDLRGDRRFLERTALRLEQTLEDPSYRFSDDGSRLAAHLVTERSSAGGNLSDVVISRSGTGAVERRVRVGRAGDWLPGAWHPDGEEYVAGTLDGTVVRISLDGSVERRPVTGAAVVALEYTHDGRHLVIADEAGRVTRIDPGTWRRSGPPARIDGIPVAMAVGPSGRRALLLLSEPARGPGELDPVTSWAVVDLGAGRVLSRHPVPEANGAEWTEVDIAPDGENRGALIGASGAVLIDLVTGDRLSRLVPAHTDGVGQGGFAPEGQALLTGGDDGRVSVWNPRTGALRDSQQFEPNTPAWPTLLPDGHTVLVVADGAVHRWDTRIDAAIEAACRVAGRSMTTAEWRTFAGERPYRATCP